MKRPVFVLCLVCTLVQASDSNHHQAFFDQLLDLCGERYQGQSSFPQDPGDAFRGQTLAAHIETCGADEIRIPFAVGENRSRTWVIRRVEKGLELKHDHRHDDGTPDEITEYGGTTQSPGTVLSQSFPADPHTGAIIPEAASNEWFLTLAEDGSSITYYLERHGEPRFRAVLYRVAPAR